MLAALLLFASLASAQNEVVATFIDGQGNVTCQVEDWPMVDELQQPADYLVVSILHEQCAIIGGQQQCDTNEIEFTGDDVLRFRYIPNTVGRLRIMPINATPDEASESYFTADFGGSQTLGRALASKNAKAMGAGVSLQHYDFQASDYDDKVAEARALIADYRDSQTANPCQ